jgi:pimeloyl-ACP methyl ester carboxylesterase
MDVDRREAVELGDSTQWIRTRARRAGNPPLLLVQMGPGLPMLNEVRAFERALALEDDFTVVHWDQRGCGRSLRSGGVLSLEAMITDTERLLALLAERFGRPAVLAGFSMGGTISAYATGRRPDLVAALVTVGMDIDGPAIEENAYRFALDTARARNNRRAIRQLDAIGPPPHLRPEQFATRSRWDMTFGGVRTGHTYASLARGQVVSLLRSPDYSPADVVRTLRGVTAARAALLPELATLDLAGTLTELKTPVVMVQGRLDQVAPPSAAQRYADLLEAPSKRLVWFEHSAHMPHLEEPARFRAVLDEVRS